MFIFMSRRGPVSPWPDPMVYDLIKKTWMMTLPNSSETYSKINIVENWDSAMLPVGFSVWWGFPGTPGTFQAPFLAHFHIAPARPPGCGRLLYLLGALTPRRGRPSARVEWIPLTVSVSVVPAGGRQPGGRQPRGCGLPNFDYPPRRTPLRLAQEGQPRHLLRAVSAGLCLSCIEIRFGNRPGYAEFSPKCRPEAHPLARGPWNLPAVLV